MSIYCYMQIDTLSKLREFMSLFQKSFNYKGHKIAILIVNTCVLCGKEFINF